MKKIEVAMRTNEVQKSRALRTVLSSIVLLFYLLFKVLLADQIDQPATFQGGWKVSNYGFAIPSVDGSTFAAPRSQSVQANVLSSFEKIADASAPDLPDTS